MVGRMAPAVPRTPSGPWALSDLLAAAWTPDCQAGRWTTSPGPGTLAEGPFDCVYPLAGRWLLAAWP